MKKLLLSMGLIGLLGGIVSIASAGSTNCKEVEFSNGVTACVNIQKVSTDRRRLVTTIDNGSTSSLRCDIMTPDSRLRSISACNGEFNYDIQKIGRTKLRIRYNEGAPIDRENKPNNNSEWTYPQRMYDFNNAERTDDSSREVYTYNSDNFYVTASPSLPAKYQGVDITVKARNGAYTDTSYRGTVQFKVERKSGSSRVTASSSLYDLLQPSYTFTSSDNGQRTFSNLISFNNNTYDYRLVVYDNNNSSIEGNKTFMFIGGGGSSNNYTTDSLSVNATDSTPGRNERIDITVEAKSNSYTDTSYKGTVQFKVERKSGSSRVTASSSYYNVSRTSFGFATSYYGKYIIDSLIRFTQDGEYRLTVYDSNDNNIKGTKTFVVDGISHNDSNSENFYLTSSPTYPSKNQSISITVQARDITTPDPSYRGTIRFTVERKSGGSRITAPSSSYTLNRYSYTFVTSDNGRRTFSNLISFNNDNYDYRLVVTDDSENRVTGYKIFYLGNTSTTSDNGILNNFDITSNTTTPNTSQYVNLTIRARDSYNDTITDYTDAVKFKVYYRTSSAYSRTETTSSTYYTMNSIYTNGTTFSLSNKGQKALTNFIRFNRNNYDYKVRVYAENDSSIYKEITFNVGSTSSSSSINGFTSSELDTVQSMYNSRDGMINDLETTYYRLRNSTRRKNMSADFRSAMREILNNSNNKTYTNYNDFMVAWIDWYRYTSSIK